MSRPSQQSFSKSFFYISHRGFGEKAHLRYSKSKSPQYAHNQLTGFELGIEKGANTLEIDLNKTSDGKIVTAHGIPFAKHLGQTTDMFFSRSPEALTLEELVDWLYHTPCINLYLELKTTISIKEIIAIVTVYSQSQLEDKQVEIVADLYQRMMFYAESTAYIQSLLSEKQNFGLHTNQLKLFVVTNLLMTKKRIEYYASLGADECRLYGIEQGAFIWANPLLLKLLRTWLNMIPPFKQVESFYNSVSELTQYAHAKQLAFIFGTIDNQYWIRKLMQQGIDGIVPNNPEYFGSINNTSSINTKVKLKYLPESLLKRIK